MTEPENPGRFARFGPFFALSVLSRSAPGWLPTSALGSDPATLTARIRAVRAGLATGGRRGSSGGSSDQVELRVALSITHLGLVARLVAVALASAVDGRPVPRLEQLRFQDRLGGPYPLAVVAAADDPTCTPPPGPTGGSWPDDVLALVEPVTGAIVDRGLSPRIARGNIASALAGAAEMIAVAEPTASARAAGLLAAALHHDRLAGTGEITGPVTAGGFRRRSCCLIYRLASRPGYCGDCVLVKG